MPYLFSVCICTYNRADQLRPLLENLSRQSLAGSDFEVLVVDNASTDGTGQVVRDYSGKIAHLQHILEMTPGASFARNRGALEAQGVWMAFLDDDSLPPEDWLEQAANVIQSAAPDLFGGPFYPYYTSPKPSWYKDEYGSGQHGPDARLLRENEYLFGGNLFIRRSLLLGHGGFPVDFGPRGNKLDFGEENVLQRDLRRTTPGIRIYYAPRLAIRHWVAPRKMSLRWRIKQRWLEGRAGYRVSNVGRHILNLRYLLGLAAIPLVILWMSTFGLLLRNRRRYPAWQNYFFEEALRMIAIGGKLYERTRVVLLTRKSPVPIADEPASSKFSHLIKRGMRFVRRKFQGHPDRLAGIDFIGSGATSLSRRALLAYIVHPFAIPPEDPRFHSHVNIWHAVEMVRTLNHMGYLVDVVDYRDSGFKLQVPYDLFIGHGGKNYQQVAAGLPEGTPKIYFSTGAYWRFHNEQEQIRLDALKHRRGVTLAPDRMILHPEENALQTADAIIGIGNQFTRQTYAGWPNVWMIPGTAKPDDRLTPEWFEAARGRRGFLFFASGGNVHKGLDLLLEAFDGLEQELWIMAPIERAFRRLYFRELFKLPNLHTLGYMLPRSSKYYETLQQCAWCILPSCSEGQAQSVVEAMNAGIIPIVSRAAGIDVDPFGVLIEPVTVESIRSSVIQAAAVSPEELAQRAHLACEAARSVYAPEMFGQNFRKALEAALAQPVASEEISREARG